jgi:Phosphoinositide phospholipase C, Ca2+-dependent
LGQPLVARLTLLVACALGLSSCARPAVLSLPAPLWMAPPAEQEAAAPVFADEAGALRIDQLQLMGSHNSYHRTPHWPLSPRFRYNHAGLAQQLEQQGVRHLEIDVRYADGRLRVGHAPIIDGQTSCSDFHACIREIKSWSRMHPMHVPVFVFVQPKEGLVSADLDDKLEVMDHEISRVFSRSELLLPREVARGYPSLRRAVNELGWPTLEATRGKVAFVLFGQSRLVAKYARGRPCLEGRLMFAAPGHAGADYAAVISIDNPLPHKDEITQAARAHLLVRTRADSGLVRDARRRDAAVLSGAHFIGTDFVDTKHVWLDLSRNTPARRNPVTTDGAARRAPVLEVERATFARVNAPTPRVN